MHVQSDEIYFIFSGSQWEYNERGWNFGSVD